MSVKDPLDALSRDKLDDNFVRSDSCSSFGLSLFVLFLLFKLSKGKSAVSIDSELSITFRTSDFRSLCSCVLSALLKSFGNGYFMLQIGEWDYTNTFASASAPALAMKGRDGWNATSNMDSSNFLRWAVISCTQVFVSKFHRRTLQSWPVQK